MSEIQIARMLGIDVQNEPQYLWIAQQAAKAQVSSDEWKEFTNEQGKTMYYNVKCKVCMSYIFVVKIYNCIENSSHSSGYCNVFSHISTPERIQRYRAYENHKANW